MSVRGRPSGSAGSGARNVTQTTAATGARDVFLDAFAAACAVAPVDTAPEEIAPLVRRTHCRVVMLITGTPGPRLLGAMRTVAAITSSLTIVRVGVPLAAGVTIATVLAGADAVVTMLPAGRHVIEVWTQLAEAVPAGTLLIDSSTIDVETARQVAQAAQIHI